MKRSRSSEDGTGSKRAKAASLQESGEGASIASESASKNVEHFKESTSEGEIKETSSLATDEDRKVTENPEMAEDTSESEGRSLPERTEQTSVVPSKDNSEPANKAAEPAKESKEPAAEPAKQPAKQPANEPAKESVKESIKESAKESAKEESAKTGSPKADEHSVEKLETVEKEGPSNNASTEIRASPLVPSQTESSQSEDKQSGIDTKSEPSVKSDDKPAAKPLGFSSFSSSKPTGFSSFSSGFGGFSSSSKFGSLANTKKANPWAEETPDESGKSAPAKDSAVDKESSRESQENDAYAQVKLEKQELKTGEENEKTLFQMRVRLYAMDLSDAEGKAWKERGTGLLKLNQAANTDKHRLLMRADGVLRVSLNLPLVQHMQVTKGFATSLHSEKFVKLAGIESGKPHQFAVRCSTEEQRDELYEAIISARP